MASTINATTASGGGLVETGDASGVLALQSNGVTIVTVSSTGEAITGNMTASGTVADATAIIRPLVSGTAVASTSGTSIDFTSIPSWVKRITVMFNGVSTSGTSYPLIQIGTGGTPTTSGYVSQASQLYTAAAISSTTAGFYINSNASTYVLSGTMTISNISGNIWVESCCFGSTAGALIMTAGSGTVTLGGVLNMLRITTVNGTDTFDAGSINIMYE